MVKGKRQLQAEQTKDKLFYAADALLAEKNYEDITIRDIITKAGVSIGTFYHYFPSKVDVFYETYRVADNYFEEVGAQQLQEGTVYENILKFFDHYAHYTCDQTHPQLIYLLYNSGNTHFNRSGDQGMNGVLYDLIRRGMESGEIRTQDAAMEIVEFLMVGMRGLVYNWATMGQSYNLPERVKWYVPRLLKAYY